MTKIIASKLKMKEADLLRLYSVLPEVAAIGFLTSWVIVCYQANLFFEQAILCSGIVAALLCYRSMIKLR